MTEFELIERLTEGAPREARDLACGVGDDCAVIAGPAGREWLVTTDALAEGIHFERAWGDLTTLGRKALAVNLSDIAAMGGAPRFFFVSIAIPDDLGPEGAMELFAGMRERATEYGVVLAGGDTSASAAGLVISITVVGEAAAGGAIRRSGAAAGDAIYVTGTLGSAAAGLAALRAGRAGGAAATFVQRLLDPAPRIEAGKVLAGCGMASAMIDVSDGLLADLGHIAEASGAGFFVEAVLLPRDPGLEPLARELGRDAVALAAAGGEEYELLFTVRERDVAAFERGVIPTLPLPATRIGTMIAERGTRLVRDAGGAPLALPLTGFDHFAGRGPRCSR